MRWGLITLLRACVSHSIAHVNPTFVFDELVVTHYCGGLRGLIALVVTALANQAVAQGYKVVGSMELLGDPLSLMSKVSQLERAKIVLIAMITDGAFGTFPRVVMLCVPHARGGINGGCSHISLGQATHSASLRVRMEAPRQHEVSRH